VNGSHSDGLVLWRYGRPRIQENISGVADNGKARHLDVPVVTFRIADGDLENIACRAFAVPLLI